MGKQNDNTGANEKQTKREYLGRSVPGVKNCGEYQNRYRKNQAEDKGKLSFVDDGLGSLDDKFLIFHITCPWFSWPGPSLAWRPAGRRPPACHRASCPWPGQFPA